MFGRNVEGIGSKQQSYNNPQMQKCKSLSDAGMRPSKEGKIGVRWDGSIRRETLWIENLSAISPVEGIALGQVGADKEHCTLGKSVGLPAPPDVPFPGKENHTGGQSRKLSSMT